MTDFIQDAAACDQDTIRELLAERDALRHALETMVGMVEMNGFGRDYAMDVARAALKEATMPSEKQMKMMPARASLKEDGFTQYRRKQIAELRPYIEGEDVSHVSISPEDAKAGSPKPGDMIARNPKNHADQWLVARDYFLDNFEAITAEQAETAKDAEPVAWLIHAPEDDYYGIGPVTLQFNPLEQWDLDKGYTQTPLYTRPPESRLREAAREAVNCITHHAEDNENTRWVLSLLNTALAQGGQR